MEGLPTPRITITKNVQQSGFESGAIVRVEEVGGGYEVKSYRVGL